MEWGYAIIGVLFVAGVLLAFPLAIGICGALGGVLVAIDRLTTRCPRCKQRRMRCTNGIRETYPTGRGTGLFYLCRACSSWWFWSNDDRAWQDASSPDFMWAFVDRRGGKAEPGSAPDPTA
jgi:hypothetical protein